MDDVAGIASAKPSDQHCHKSFTVHADVEVPRDFVHFYVPVDSAPFSDLLLHFVHRA